jgi:hypothetical protein
MLTFIVLGYFPGTHTQLTFSLLLYAVALLVAPFVIVRVAHVVQLKHRTHQLFLDIVSI